MPCRRRKVESGGRFALQRREPKWLRHELPGEAAPSDVVAGDFRVPMKYLPHVNVASRLTEIEVRVLSTGTYPRDVG